MLLETGERCGVKAHCFPSSIFMFSCKSVFEPDKNLVFFLKASTSLTPITPGSTGAGPVADEL